MKWPYRKIAEFCVTGSGGTPLRRKAGLYYGGDIPWVKSGELKDSVLLKTDETITKKGLEESSAKIIPAGAILIAMYGATAGKTALLGINATTNQAICNMQPNPEIVENKFLWYFLKSIIKELLQKRVGGAQPNINQQIIKKIAVPVPPISEQKRIVEILDQADRLRKLRAEADKKALRVRLALFIKIFGDPAKNPMRWKIGKLGDVIDETQYGTSKRANTNGEGIPVLRMNNIDYDGHLHLVNMKHVELSEREQERYALTDGDILFNRTNSKELVGKTCLWCGKTPAVIASYLIRVRLNNTMVIPEFVWVYMNCPFIKQLLLNMSRRAIGMANINAKELRDIPLILPGIKKQKTFVEKSICIKQFREQRIESNENLNKLFNTLLYHAFTGDLTTSWRKAHMKELMQEMEIQAKALTS